MNSSESNMLNRKFSQTEVNEYFKKLCGNGRYRNYDLQFENVLQNKALSLISASPKAKHRLTHKRLSNNNINNSSFESIYKYKQRMYYIPSFKETINMYLSK